MAKLVMGAAVMNMRDGTYAFVLLLDGKVIQGPLGEFKTRKEAEAASSKVLELSLENLKKQFPETYGGDTLRVRRDIKEDAHGNPVG